MLVLQGDNTLTSLLCTSYTMLFHQIPFFFPFVKFFKGGASIKETFAYSSRLIHNISLSQRVLQIEPLTVFPYRTDFIVYFFLPQRKQGLKVLHACHLVDVNARSKRVDVSIKKEKKGITVYRGTKKRTRVHLYRQAMYVRWKPNSIVFNNNTSRSIK